MSQMRILFITHAYYNKGGVEEHVRDLSEKIGKAYKAYILTPVQHGKLQHFQLLENGVIKKIFPANFIPWPMTPFKDNLAMQALNQSINIVNPNIIHIHHIQNWPLEILYNICKTSIPTALTIHDYFLATPLFTMEFSEHPKELLSKDYALKIFGSDISEYLKQRREVITNSINKIKVLITPTVSAKDEISKAIPAEYKVIPHGIKSFVLKTRPKSNKLRFGFVGSIIRQKGWQTLLEANNRLDKFKDKYELQIYGAGYDSDKLSSYNNIDYRGSYTKKDLPDILSNFDVGIIPSIFKETFCYTKAEMQSANCPLIVSNIGALPENINKDIGLVFNPGDANDLSEKMVDMINNYKSKSWLIPKPRTTFEMTNDYLTLYSELL